MRIEYSDLEGRHAGAWAVALSSTTDAQTLHPYGQGN
jgi:hypothetical protein